MRGNLAPGSSAQKADIITLTRTVSAAEGKWVNIYMDPRSAFFAVYVHGTIWKERGFLTSNTKDTNHTAEILSLSEAAHKPSQVAVMPLPGHQRGESHTIKGKQLADCAAKKAVITP